MELINSYNHLSFNIRNKIKERKNIFYFLQYLLFNTREKRNICFPGQESNSGNKTHSKPNTAAFSKPNSGHKKDISPFLVTKQQQQRCHLEKKNLSRQEQFRKEGCRHKTICK